MLSPRKFTVPALCLAASFFSSSLASQSVFETPWPLLPVGETSEEGELWGQLENGLRYAVIPTDSASESVSLRLLVAAGRANEAEGKAGVSYLASDLFFQGTEHFDRAALAAFAIEHGMDSRFGSRTRVELDYTVFGLDLEEAGEQSVSQALRFFGDIAGTSGVDASKLESLKSSVAHRAKLGASLYFPSQARKERVLLSDSKYSKIGDELVSKQIGAAGMEDVRSYWSKWYKPERMLLVVSGIVEPSQVEGLIRETFAKLEASESVVPLRSPSGKFRSAGDLESEKSNDVYAHLSVFKTWSSPNRFEPDQERRIYETDFLGRLAEALSSDSKRVGSQTVDFYGDYLAMNLSKRSQVLGLLEDMVKMDKAIHQLQAFELRPEDFDRAKSEYLELRSSYDPMLSEREWPTLVADRLVRCVVEETPFRYGKSLSRYVEKAIAPFAYEEARDRCKALFELKRLSFLVLLPEGFELPSKVISKRLKTVRKGYDFTWENAGDVGQDYEINSSFQSSGIVESTELIRIEDYPALQYEFSNNLRLNLVKADPKPGRAVIRLSIGNGTTSLESANPAFVALARILFLDMKVGSGLQAPSVREVLEAKGLESVSAGVNTAQLYWEAEGKTEEDLSEFLSTTILWLVTSKLEEDAFDDAKEELEKGIASKFGNPGALALEEALFGKEDRMRRYFSEEELEAIRFSDFEAWLKKTREEGYVEITVVGDVAPRTVLRDTRRSFGSTPLRKGKVVQPRHATPMVWSEPGVERSSYDSSLENGYVSLLFPVSVEDSCEDELRLKVFRLLMLDHATDRLADKPQLLSSIDIAIVGDQMVPGSSALRLQALCSESESEEALESLQSIAASFAESITPEMLAAAERGAWLDLKRIVRSSDALIALFDQSQGRPNRLACLLGKLDKGVSGSLEEYQEKARQQFSEENVRGVVLMPKGK